VKVKPVFKRGFMTAIDNTPINRNYLSPLNFKFTIKKAPHVNFFIQRVKIPDMTLPAPNYPNPMVNIPLIGDHITYGDFEVTFKVDEDLKDYLEIHNWIKALGKPIDFTERRAIRQVEEFTGEGERSDLSLIVLTSNKAANYEAVFTDAYPYYISQLDFNTTDKDVIYIQATARFKYVYFEINRI
jgi:hypothetical protein